MDAGGEVTLDTEATGLLTSRSDAVELTVLVNTSNNPVDTGIAADGLVRRINHDNLEVLESSILSNPERVEDTEVTAALSSTLLSNATEGASSLDTLDTLVDGLTVDDTLGVLTLGGTTGDTDTVEDIALLGLVAHAASLIGASSLAALHDRGELAVLPGTETRDEAHDIGLLLSPKLFKILVGT